MELLHKIKDFRNLMKILSLLKVLVEKGILRLLFHSSINSYTLCMDGQKKKFSFNGIT